MVSVTILENNIHQTMDWIYFFEKDEQNLSPRMTNAEVIPVYHFVA